MTLDDVAVIGYEPNSGYADPYMTTMGFIAGARRLGVEVLTETPAMGLLQEGDRVTGVRTGRGDFPAATVLAAIGPWSNLVGDWAGVHLSLEAPKHVVLNLQETGQAVGRER